MSWPKPFTSQQKRSKRRQLSPRKNLLAKKHGSVTLTKPFLESEFSVKEKRQLNEKNAIAEKALDFIPQNASLYLDTSTTVLQLAKLLVMRDDLTIVTNSLQISQILATSDNQVLLTGGQFRKKEQLLRRCLDITRVANSESGPRFSWL